MEGDNTRQEGPEELKKKKKKVNQSYFKELYTLCFTICSMTTEAPFPHLSLQSQKLE